MSSRNNRVPSKRSKISCGNLVNMFKNSNDVKLRNDIFDVLLAMNNVSNSTSFHDLNDAELVAFMEYCREQVFYLKDSIAILKKQLRKLRRVPLRITLQRKKHDEKAKKIYEKTIRQINWEMEVRSLNSLLPLFL